MHYLGQPVKSKLVTVEQALTLFQIKLQTYLTLMSQIYALGPSDRPATLEAAFHSIRPLMIDQIYQKTGGVEWEEVEDRVAGIVKEQVAAGNQVFISLTS